jgi:uncharacterized protein (TIGR03032 family)
MGLPRLLERLGISLLVSTYQAGKLMAVRQVDGTMHTLLRTFERPMGIAVKDNRQFALGTSKQLWDFRNAPEIARQIKPLGQYDTCFLPRASFVTGDILGHDLGWAGDELWIVNTLFSCLCTLDFDHSFVPRWQPPFVSALVPQDRCHLNGLCVVDNQPRYVTALGDTDTPEGWRINKAHGGILIDVATRQIISRGLSMPHSPRLHGDRLWLLEGGTGRLSIVEVASGRCETVTEFPGFARGVAFHDSYAFVGLSKIRESATFGGLPIASRVEDLRCGIWVVDLNAARIVEFMQFQSGVDEIFAIEVLAGIRFPEVLGFEEDTLDKTYVLPS